MATENKVAQPVVDELSTLRARVAELEKKIEGRITNNKKLIDATAKLIALTQENKQLHADIADLRSQLRAERTVSLQVVEELDREQRARDAREQQIACYRQGFELDQDSTLGQLESAALWSVAMTGRKRNLS